MKGQYILPFLIALAFLVYHSAAHLILSADTYCYFPHLNLSLNPHFHLVLRIREPIFHAENKLYLSIFFEAL